MRPIQEADARFKLVTIRQHPRRLAELPLVAVTVQAASKIAGFQDVQLSSDLRRRGHCVEAQARGRGYSNTGTLIEEPATVGRRECGQGE